MSTRNQVLALFTALIVVCSSGSMAVGAASGTTVSDDDSSGNGVAEGEPIADDEPKTDERDDRPQPAKITFDDQTTDGDTVVVDEVAMASGGFVAIHDSRLFAGDVVESVIGVSAYLEAGTHENVEVTLDEPLEGDETLIAMPHRDTNDDRKFDFVETEGKLDIPYLTPDDEPVTDDAVVSLEEETEPVEEEPEPVEERIPDDERAIEAIVEQTDIFVIEVPKKVDEIEEEPEEVDEVEEEPEEVDEVEEEPEEVDEVEEEPAEIEADEDEELAPPDEPVGPTGPEKDDEDEASDGDGIEVEGADGVDIEVEGADEVDVDANGSDAARASVTLEDQANDGDAIEVDGARLPDGGFVALYDSGLLEGQITESFVGASGFLEAETHENVRIEPVRPLEDDAALLAVAHRDTNGNQAFDLLETEGQEDGPYLTPADETVVDDAVVTVEDDE